MTEIVKAELERIAGIKNQKDGDYFLDGILYCGGCHEAKQAWVDWLPDADGNPQKKLVPIMCRCAVEEENREKQKKIDQRYVELQRHFDLAIQGQMRTMYTSVFCDDTAPGTPIARTCRDYVDRWEDMKRDNMGILFFGSKGTGKSFYASCIVNALRDRKIVACMTTTANLMTMLSAWDKTETMDAISRVPLLVLDDLGAERDTSYSAEMMYNVVNTRYAAQKPTIITTNLDLAEMQAETDLWRARIYDRAIEMCPITLRMQGESRRAGIADERKRKAREILRRAGA